MTQTMVEKSPGMPPVVYVPTTDDPEPHQRRVILHQVEDGRTALYTYSAPDRLDSFYRADNPWVLCDVPTLQRIHDEMPFDLLFVDVDPDLADEPVAEETGA